MNVLVTGGTRVLGFATARLLLERGHRVWVVGRSSSEAVQELQTQYGEQLRFAACDLSDLSTIKELVFDKMIGAEPLHAVVNNAAYAYDDLVTNLSLEKLEAMFSVNVYVPMLVTKLAIRNMLLHRSAGSIVHVSSVSTQQGYKGLSMYAATKGALEAFSKNVAREWGRMKIRSNCVVPGFMETDMSSSLSDEQRQKIYGRTALGCATDVNDVARMIEYLISDVSSCVTGQNFVVDAGTV